jgi:dsRNA-specific ribonuclease
LKNFPEPKAAIKNFSTPSSTITSIKDNAVIWAKHNIDLVPLMDEKRRAKLQKFLSGPIFNIVDVKEEELNRYDQALTHSSFANEMKVINMECEDYERLEFLGNFVLDFVVSEQVFKRFKDDSEKYMTERMKIVSNEILAEIVKKKVCVYLSRPPHLHHLHSPLKATLNRKSSVL